jgi:lipopolysaccharide transport system ATP-binding protein
MPQPVISVENLSKSYQLGTISTGTAFRDLERWWAKKRGKPDPFRRIGEIDHGNRQGETIWALKDINFAVQQGEALGIIGRNGAGKSTLLKILSQVTTPTSGVVKVKGRIASLLEIGTGFHAELTGRENIYLNGAINGMTRAEVKRKLDEIVDFSGVEQFIDTPVKRYSSGMYVRLAFAVAAHLEPDILIVDEVLAVGDADFQKKCLSKMGDEGREGRTVLFVSHNLQAIRNLCPRCILLNIGEIIIDADTETTLSTYKGKLREITIDDKTGIGDAKFRRGDGAIRFTSIALQDLEKNSRYTFEMGETIRFIMAYKIFREIEGLAVYIGLRSNLSGEPVTSVVHTISTKKITTGTVGTVTIDLPEIYIRPGEYSMYLHISGAIPTATNFDVLDGLTPPLIVIAGNIVDHYNFDVTRPSGFFSIPSRIIANEMQES